MDRIHRIQHESLTIAFRLERRRRRTMAIRVNPDQTVDVFAPMNAPLAWIYQVVGKRSAWIVAKMRFHAESRLTPPKQFVSGELFSYLGEPHRLTVVPESPTGVTIAPGEIIVRSGSPERPDIIRKLVETWFLEQSAQKLSERLNHCLTLFPDPQAVRPTRVVVRRLTSRWGSMTSAGRMGLNSRLIHAPVACMDYVIIHELCHRIHPNHGRDFWQMVGSIMPQWKDARKRLKLVTD